MKKLLLKRVSSVRGVSSSGKIFQLNSKYITAANCNCNNSIIKNQFSTSTNTRKSSSIDNDPLLKILDFAKQEKLKEDGFKKTKDGRFFTKTYIDPEMMTEDERDEFQNRGIEFEDENEFDKWMKNLEKEERVLQRKADEAFLQTDLPSSMKSFSFSELLDEAEQYLIHGKPIPHFNTLPSHIPLGEKEDLHQRPDFSHFKSQPPTLKDIRETVQFTESNEEEDSSPSSVKQRKKEMIRKSDGKIDHVQSERNMYYQAPKTQSTTQPQEKQQTPVEYSTPDDYERIRVPEDAYSAYYYFRNEVYIRGLDVPRTKEEEDEEIADFFIEAYSNQNSVQHYLDDPLVKQQLLKHYDKFDKVVDQITVDQMPTPASVLTKALDITEASDNQKLKREKSNDKFFDHLSELNRKLHAKGEVVYKFQYNPTTKRIERTRSVIDEDKSLEPIQEKDLNTEDVEKEEPIVDYDKEGLNQLEIEMLDQYFKDMEAEQSNRSYRDEASTEEILLSRLMKRVNPKKDDIEEFSETELLELQKLVKQNKHKFAELERKSGTVKEPLPPSKNMFMPSQDELERSFKEDFGVNIGEFQELIEQYPQLGNLMENMQGDSEFIFNSLSQYIVENGGIQKLEHDFNDKSKVNRSFKEWVKVKRESSGLTDLSTEELVKELENRYKE